MFTRALTLAALALIPAAALAAPASITGRWVTEDRDAIVTISPCGESLCGRVVKFLKRPPGGEGQRDVNNPDPKLRSRPLLGLAVLTGFKADGDLWRGRIYDPKSGKSYRSVIRRSGNALSVKGCIGPFCKGQSWARAE